MAEAEDNDGWQEAGCSGGDEGATVVWQERRNSAMEDGAEVEDGWGGAGWGVHFFSFLGGVESYIQSYPLQSFWGGGFCYD